MNNLRKFDEDKQKNEFLKEISPCIFWDIDISKLDIKEDKKFIIERVYTRGFEKDEILLWKIYSFGEIKKQWKR